MSWFNLFNKNINSNLLFIFGCPRGGTTWIWSILESHQEVVPFLQDYSKNDNIYSTSESGIYVKNIKQAKNKINKFIKNNPKKLIIEKTPSHLFFYDKIKKDFPNSKVVIVFRNPIAVVNSMMHSKMKAFENYDLNKSINEVKRYYSSLKEIYTLPKTFYFFYENLYSNQKYELNRIMNFLNLNTDTIEKLIDDNKSPKISVKGAYRKVYPDSYLEEFSNDEINFISKALHEEINFYNKIYSENSSNK